MPLQQVRAKVIYQRVWVWIRGLGSRAPPLAFCQEPLWNSSILRFGWIFLKVKNIKPQSLKAIPNPAPLIIKDRTFHCFTPSGASGASSIFSSSSLAKQTRSRFKIIKRLGGSTKHIRLVWQERHVVGALKWRDYLFGILCCYRETAHSELLWQNYGRRILNGRMFWAFERFESFNGLKVLAFERFKSLTVWMPECFESAECFEYVSVSRIECLESLNVLNSKELNWTCWIVSNIWRVECVESFECFGCLNVSKLDRCDFLNGLTMFNAWMYEFCQVLDVVNVWMFDLFECLNDLNVWMLWMSGRNWMGGAYAWRDLPIPKG